MAAFTKYLDPDFPLLEKLREIAPGTFKHSQNVMSICEHVADVLSLDKDILRCAAMYHDIGKTHNPIWFTENQNGENPHDNVEPKFSYEMITRHVSDSCMVLAQNGFPVEVISLVSMHHGNTITASFWKKSGETPETKDSFRYHSITPNSTEAVVLMVCDRVEAQARSMFQSGSLNRETLIDAIITDLMSDGQLDKITIGDLRKLKDVLNSEIHALYHERIDYDKIKPSKASKDNVDKK
jgi:hypothetical protein